MVTLVAAIVAVVLARSYMVSRLTPYMSAVRNAKEAVLREDCHVVHNAIDAYTIDLGKSPKSLEDLIQAGYLKALPKDFSLEGCK
jgi:general secretion pathway protein G